jgi:hypothetical protein
MKYFPFFAVLSVTIVSFLVYQDHKSHKTPMFRYSPKLATSEEQIVAQEKQLVKHILWRKMQNKVKQINSTQGKDFLTF